MIHTPRYIRSDKLCWNLNIRFWNFSWTNFGAKIEWSEGHEKTTKANLFVFVPFWDGKANSVAIFFFFIFSCKNELIFWTFQKKSTAVYFQWVMRIFAKFQLIIQFATAFVGKIIALSLMQEIEMVKWSSVNNDDGVNQLKIAVFWLDIKTIEDFSACQWFSLANRRY